VFETGKKKRFRMRLKLMMCSFSSMEGEVILIHSGNEEKLWMAFVFVEMQLKWSLGIYSMLVTEAASRT